MTRPLPKHWQTAAVAAVLGLNVAIMVTGLVLLVRGPFVAGLAMVLAGGFSVYMLAYLTTAHSPEPATDMFEIEEHDDGDTSPFGTIVAGPGRVEAYQDAGTVRLLPPDTAEDVARELQYAAQLARGRDDQVPEEQKVVDFYRSTLITHQPDPVLAIEALLRQLVAKHIDHVHACVTVASMHNAATSPGRPPGADPVRDVERLRARTERCTQLLDGIDATRLAELADDVGRIPGPDYRHAADDLRHLAGYLADREAKRDA